MQLLIQEQNSTQEKKNEHLKTSLMKIAVRKLTHVQNVDLEKKEKMLTLLKIIINNKR